MPDENENTEPRVTDTTPVTPEVEATPEIEDGTLNVETVAELLEEEADDMDEPTEAPMSSEGQKLEEPGTEEVTPEAVPPEVAPSTPAAPEPVVATTEPTSPEPTPEQKPPEVPPVASAEPEPLTMDQIRENYQNNRTELEANVATEVYGLSDEQVQRLDDGDSELIPELMARVYMDAVTGSVAHMITYLPQMVDSVLKGRDRATELEGKFYEFWPTIDKGEHADTVRRFGQAYRQLYPTASIDDFIRDVGAQVVVAMKIPQAATSLETQVQAEVKPPPPFTPARGAGGGTGAVKPINPFESLSDEMAMEDLDAD